MFCGLNFVIKDCAALLVQIPPGKVLFKVDYRSRRLAAKNVIIAANPSDEIACYAPDIYKVLAVNNRWCIVVPLVSLIAVA
jgi:hypothetical protein